MKPSSRLQKTCFYCANSYSERDGEHIFPEGLGGQRLMMDCVCGQCNNKFSALENELISKSFISFMRVAEDPVSTSKNKQRIMHHARTLRFDDELQTGLEVLVTNQLKEKLVAQIVLKDNMLQIRYEDQADFAKLLGDIVAWKVSNLTVTLKENGNLVCLIVAKDEQNQTVTRIPISTAKKGFIGFIILSEEDKDGELLFPRIFSDSKGRLKIRARKQSEAFELIRHLLWWDSTFRPESEKVINKVHEISVKQTHNGVMLNRAILKIILNCLVACYPEVKNEREKLLEALSFVMEGSGDAPFVATHSKSDLDKVASTHNLFFINSKEETRVRFSLYNGAFQIIFQLPRLNALDLKGPGRLLIDHVNMQNVFQDYKVLDAALEALDRSSV